MRNIEIFPDDVVIVTEFRMSELKKIQRAMVNTTVALNLSDPDDKEAHDFFVGNFMNWINSTLKTIENG